MHRYFSPLIAGSVLGGLLAATSVSAAHAAASEGDLATALDLPAGITVAKAGAPEAFGVASTAFNDFPRRGGNAEYAVMSTGAADDLFNMSVPGLQPSTDFRDREDSVSMTFTVGPEASGSCLLVDVAMGTEERAGYIVDTDPSDTISLKIDGDPSGTEYAKHAGPRYIGQAGSDSDRDGTAVKPTAMSANAVKYWHGINEEFERQPDDQAAPLLPAITPFNHFTSVETLEVPVSEGSVTLSISDANNADLDSVAMIDRVRMAARCSTDAGARTGLFPEKPAVVVGHRGVQNILTVDLVPETPEIERYDAADNGWYPSGVDLRFRWYRYRSTTSSCNDGTLANWTPINNADRQSFSPTIDEKGRCLLALVTGKKDGYRSETFPSPGTAAWTPTLNIQDGVFTNLDIPTITSPHPEVRVNDVLTATNGTFTPRPDGYAYQWYADSLPISGVSEPTFKVTAAQAGKVIRVRVTADRLNFNAMTIQSSPTVPVTRLTFTSIPIPTLSGSGVQGQRLQVHPGAWTPETDKFEYEWYANDVKIANQTGATFTPSVGLVGSRVHAVVKGVRSGYQPDSRPTAKITIAAASFTAGRVSISGTPRVGQRLTATAEGWAPTTPSTRTYIWRVGSTVLQRGSSTTLTVPASVAGKAIHVQVLGQRTGYAPITITSSPTPAVARGIIASGVPRIYGSARPGRTLSASVRWTPSPVTYRYQWYVGSKRISRATKSSYRIPKAYRGKRIRVRVTGYKTGYTTVSRYSASLRVARS